jgi:hypothetical protein
MRQDRRPGVASPRSMQSVPKLHLDIHFRYTTANGKSIPSRTPNTPLQPPIFNVGVRGTWHPLVLAIDSVKQFGLLRLSGTRSELDRARAGAPGHGAAERVGLTNSRAGQPSKRGLKNLVPLRRSSLTLANPAYRPAYSRLSDRPKVSPRTRQGNPHSEKTGDNTGPSGDRCPYPVIYRSLTRLPETKHAALNLDGSSWLLLYQTNPWKIPSLTPSGTELRPVLALAYQTIQECCSSKQQS